MNQLERSGTSLGLMCRRRQNSVRGRSSLCRQRGLGLLGWLSVLFLIGVVATLTIRITPHLLTFNGVQHAIETVDTPTLNSSHAKIMSSIGAQLKIESIYDLKAADIVEVSKDDERVLFEVDYRVDEPLFSVGFYDFGVYLHFRRDISRPLR